MAEGESRRGGNGLVALFIAVLGLFGIRAAVSDPSATDKGGKSEHAANMSQGGVIHPGNVGDPDTVPFWQPVDDFRGLASRPRQWPSVAICLPRLVGLVFRELTASLALTPEPEPDVDGWESRFLIACVPDPDDSSSGDRFDGLIDGLQRAVETQGYVLDRYYYPWPRRVGPGRLGGSGGDGHPGKPEPDYTDEGKRKRKHRPGMLLFRSPMRLKNCVGKRPEPGGGTLPDAAVVALGGPFGLWQPKRLLQVLLVGETATAGADKEAFGNCLDYIRHSHWVRKHRPCDPVPEVLVLGPYFSGSQSSLEQAIHDRPQEMGTEVHFQLVSGAANGVIKGEMESAPRSPDKAFFHATVAPESAIFSALLEHLHLAHKRRTGTGQLGVYRFNERFAVLYESNTTFGLRAYQGIQRSIAQSTNGSRAPAPVLFPFPLQISQVRAEYDQSTEAAPDKGLRLPVFGSKLRLSLQSEKQLREAEPSLDPGATAVVSERTLDAMLNVIARERLRYAFIIATDVKDQLFLAQVIRKYCPECRLVFTDSNLLYGHPQFSADLRGSFVASTYPLYPDNQRWSYPGAGWWKRPLFPGPEEIGYYNATVALLNPDDGTSLLEYGPPFAGLWSDEVDQQVPPVWISIAGQGGLYPVTTVPAAAPGKEKDATPGAVVVYRGYVHRGPAHHSSSVASQDSTAETKSAAGMVPATPTLWIAIVLGLALLLCWTALGGVRAALDPKTAVGSGQTLFASVCLVSALAAYCYVIWILLIPPALQIAYADVSRVPWWYWVASTLAVVPLVVVAPTFLKWLGDHFLPWLFDDFPAWLRRNVRAGLRRDLPAWVRQWRGSAAGGGGDGGPLVGPRVVLAACLLVVVLIPGYALWKYGLLYRFRNFPDSPPSHPGGSFLLYVRASTVSSGVSPVLPVALLAVAIYAWGYVQLRRLTLQKKWQGTDPFPAQSDPSPGPPTAERRWLEGVSDCSKRLAGDLDAPPRAIADGWNPLIWCVLIFVLYRITNHFTPAAEWLPVEVALLAAMAALAMLIVAGWMHARKLWGGLRRLLRLLAELPMRDAFKNVPSGVAGLYGPYLSYAKSGQTDFLPYRLQQYQLVKNAYERMDEELSNAERSNQKLPRRGGELHPYVQAALVLKTVFGGAPPPSKADHEVLSSATRACLTALAYWWDRPEPPGRTDEKASGRRDSSTAVELIAAVAESQKASLEQWDVVPGPVRACLETVVNVWGGPADRVRAAEQSSVDPKVEAAVANCRARVEDFVAMELTIYLSQFCAQIRNVTLYLSVAPLLLLLAASSYAFQPQRLWLLLAGGMIAVVAATVIRMVFIAERDEVISRIQKTTPDQIDLRWGFLSHIALYAAPVLGLIVALSPSGSDLVHAWLDPILNMLR